MEDIAKTTKASANAEAFVVLGKLLNGEKPCKYRAFHFLVEIIGVEPMTSCMPCKRSSQLSYTPMISKSAAKITVFCKKKRIVKKILKLLAEEAAPLVRPLAYLHL